MTRDVKESLTALLFASIFVGLLLLLPLLPGDATIPGWVLPVGLGLNTLILVAAIVRDRRRARR